LSIKSITIQHSRNKVFVSKNGCMTVTAMTKRLNVQCSDARVQGEERIQQVLSVASNTSEQFAINNDKAHFKISLKFSK